MEWKLFVDLAEVADGRTVSVEVDSGATVRDALDALLSARPALEPRVLDESGALREHINVLRNGEGLTSDGLDATVDGDDELALFPPVSGG
ncbi:MAG: ubiquitin-like small modifier protein 1 [Halobacteriota archaeon]